MQTLHALLAQPIIHGAVLGWWTAFSVDLGLFLHTNNWHVAGFDWGVATKRWVTGLITGGLGAAGLNLVA